jgi:transposase
LGRLGADSQADLATREEHEALAAARACLEGKAGRKLYAQRQGVESAIAQATCVLGLRRARYCGLAKTHLQNVATAAATDIDRLGGAP